MTIIRALHIKKYMSNVLRYAYYTIFYTKLVQRVDIVVLMFFPECTARYRPIPIPFHLFPCAILEAKVIGERSICANLAKISATVSFYTVGSLRICESYNTQS